MAIDAKEYAEDFLEAHQLRLHLEIQRGAGSIPGRGAKIPYVLQSKKTKHKTDMMS